MTDPTIRAPYPHPNTWLTIGEAARYLKRKPSAVRALIAKGKLAPDGRGPRGMHMFRLGTLDKFLEAGARPADRCTCCGHRGPGRCACEPCRCTACSRERDQAMERAREIAGDRPVSPDDLDPEDPEDMPF